MKNINVKNYELTEYVPFDFLNNFSVFQFLHTLISLDFSETRSVKHKNKFRIHLSSYFRLETKNTIDLNKSNKRTFGALRKIYCERKPLYAVKWTN